MLCARRNVIGSFSFDQWATAYDIWLIIKSRLFCSMLRIENFRSPAVRLDLIKKRWERGPIQQNRPPLLNSVPFFVTNNQMRSSKLKLVFFSVIGKWSLFPFIYYFHVSGLLSLLRVCWPVQSTLPVHIEPQQSVVQSAPSMTDTFQLPTLSHPLANQLKENELPTRQLIKNKQGLKETIRLQTNYPRDLYTFFFSF